MNELEFYFLLKNLFEVTVVWPHAYNHKQSCTALDRYFQERVQVLPLP